MVCNYYIIAILLQLLQLYRNIRFFLKKKKSCNLYICFTCNNFNIELINL